MTSSEVVFKGLKMDLNQQKIFIRSYLSLPKKSVSTIRFFNHSDFYSVHEEDTQIAATFLKNINVVHTIGENPTIKYVCLSKKNFESLVRELLLIMQYRVEVYLKSNQRNNEWVLEYKGSPGHLQQFENILFDNEETFCTSSVMGINILNQNKNSLLTLGVASIDSTEGVMLVNEFTDNEFFTDLEGIIAELCPKECIIPNGQTSELKSLRKVLERNGVLVTTNKKSEFNENDIVQDLNRLLYFAVNELRNCHIFSELDKHNAMCSLQVVIKYLNLMGQEENYNQYKLKILDINKRVRLDNAAISALHLFRKDGQRSTDKFDSIYGVLNNCSTSQGKRLLEKWIKQPCSDINVLTERLNVVEALVNDPENRTQLARYSLTKIPELLLLAKKIGSKKANLQDCYRIYQAVYNAPSLVYTLEKISNPAVNYLLIEPISEILADFVKYQQMIENMLDFDLVDQKEFLIKASFDPNLEELWVSKQDLQKQMQNELRKCARELNFEAGKNIKLECNDKYGYYFRVTIKDEPILRERTEFEILDALNNGVRFTNGTLKDLNTDYSEIHSTYEKQQQEIVEEVLIIASGYSSNLKNLNMCIAEIDVLVSLATAAANAPKAFVRPKLLPSGSGILRMKKARHPCLEKQDGFNFIPNDVDFNQDEKVLHIITGPNMSGKSTYMRTIGVNVLLAHIGSFVACDEAEISIVDCILTRVGSNDSELKGMSTFMMEMVETCGITRSATDKSFVIIDELGRGTATYDGCGIAASIIEYLATEAKAFTLFATHFHELTNLKEKIPTISNLQVSVTISKDHIIPLYTIREGVCDQSYGIYCARIAGMDEGVLKDAKNHLENLEYTKSMKYIKDYEYDIKKEIIDKGDAIIATIVDPFIDKCANINFSESGIKAILDEGHIIIPEDTDNLFLKGLLD